MFKYKSYAEMDKLYSIVEAARFLNVSTRTIRRHLVDEMPETYLRIGASIRFHIKDLCAYSHFKQSWAALNATQKEHIIDYNGELL